jgi:hypothetical protein
VSNNSLKRTSILGNRLPLFTELPRGRLGDDLLGLRERQSPGLFTEGFYRYSVFLSRYPVVSTALRRPDLVCN